MPVAAADERVAVREPRGAEDGIAKRFRAVAAFALLAEQWHFVLPNDFPSAVVFAHHSVALVCYEVMAVGNLAHEPRVAVGAWMVHLQFDLVLNLPVLVHLDDARRAGLDDHRQPVV